MGAPSISGRRGGGGQDRVRGKGAPFDSRIRLLSADSASGGRGGMAPLGTPMVVMYSGDGCDVQWRWL